MQLQKLSILNFKNIDTKTFEFGSRINCFVGNNGVGKTNVLDAIYYLSFTKSYFNPLAIQNIKHGEDFFMFLSCRRKAANSGNFSSDLVPLKRLT